MEMAILLLLWPLPVCSAFLVPHRYTLPMVGILSMSGLGVLSWLLSAQEANIIAVYMGILYLLIGIGVVLGGIARLACFWLAKIRFGNYVAGFLFVSAAAFHLCVILFLGWPH